ncbi:hypothetical protein [uncultured Leifsonia sp.]|uniref:hypothetical protein n=1 Tax=uncultured Leifsonia sp. TaxID=340359 RepID=UPI0028D7F58A|nr:hypothetical protein [uncultured Leifsonia sp.]
MTTTIDQTILDLARSLPGGAAATSSHDPVAVEAIAAALSERIGSSGVVVVWERLDDVVLGHVIATRLRAPLARAFVDEGVIGFDGDFSSGGPAVIVVSEPDAYPGVTALARLARASGATAIVVATVTSPREPIDLDDVHVIDLSAAEAVRGDRD